VYHKLIQTLRSRGLVPAALVTFALAAALLAPPVGAALRPFMTTSYPCTAVTLTAQPASTASAGTQVLLTASATCPSPSPSYEFWAEWVGTTSYTMIQSYSTTATYTWNSSGAAAGTEHFGVWAKDATSSAAYDVFTSISYAVTATVAGNCTAVTESASPPSPISSGTGVTFTGSGTCPHANPAYEFWMRAASQSSWQLLQSYSPMPYVWNSTGAAAGVVNFGVWVKDSGSTAAYDAVVNYAMTVTTPACTSVAIAAVPTTVVHGVGTHSILTATPTGCTNANPLYEFWAKWAGTSNWVLLQGYGTAATYDWNSSGALAGVENFGVWIKDAHSIAAYDNFASTTVTVT